MTPAAQRISIREYLVGLGLPAMFFAVAFSMTGFVNFWVGVVGSAAAILWFFADWIYLSRGLPWLPRAVGVACGSTTALFIAWVSLRDAPLSMVAISPAETYQEGADILGIKWKNGYSPVEIMISNGTSSDYNDVNVYARTNLMISEICVKGYINQCVATPELPFVDMLLGADGFGYARPAARSAGCALDRGGMCRRRDGRYSVDVLAGRRRRDMRTMGLRTRVAVIVYGYLVVISVFAIFLALQQLPQDLYGIQLEKLNTAERFVGSVIVVAPVILALLWDRLMRRLALLKRGRSSAPPIVAEGGCR